MIYESSMERIQFLIIYIHTVEISISFISISRPEKVTVNFLILKETAFKVADLVLCS